MNENRITQEQIDSLFATCRISTTDMGRKSTVMFCILPNGFELVAFSSCVDPANYDLAIGEAQCEKKIKDRLWQLEGYRLQCDLHRAALGQGEDALVDGGDE